MFDFTRLKEGDEVLGLDGRVYVVAYSVSALLGLDTYPSIECFMNLQGEHSCSVCLNRRFGRRDIERGTCRLCGRGLCFKLKE